MFLYANICTLFYNTQRIKTTTTTTNNNTNKNIFGQKVFYTEKQ